MYCKAHGKLTEPLHSKANGQWYKTQWQPVPHNVLQGFFAEFTPFFQCLFCTGEPRPGHSKQMRAMSTEYGEIIPSLDLLSMLLPTQFCILLAFTTARAIMIVRGWNIICKRSWESWVCSAQEELNIWSLFSILFSSEPKNSTSSHETSPSTK